MKKSWKQWMAITCALAMIVSLLPVTILAEKGVATPTDLGPVVEPVQENETAEEEKATVTAGIAVSKRDGKIYLTAVAEPELVGEITWEMRTPGRNEEKWTRIETTAVTLMIIPGSELIGKEIRFVLEDGTTPVRNYIVPELVMEESAEETTTEEVLDIEEYETPLGLGDVIDIEPEIREEPAEEMAENLVEISSAHHDKVKNDQVEVETIEEIPGTIAETEKEIDVREEADGMSAIFATLSTNAEFAIISIDGDWVMVAVDDQIGYIYKADLEGIADLPEETAKDKAPEMKVVIFSSRRTQMSEGETVYLTSRLIGLDGYEIEYQWECDKHDGAGFRDVEGANSETFSFNATVETLSWDWRLSVFY